MLLDLPVTGFPPSCAGGSHANETKVGPWSKTFGWVGGSGGSDEK